MAMEGVLGKRLQEGNPRVGRCESRATVGQVRQVGLIRRAGRLSRHRKWKLGSEKPTPGKIIIEPELWNTTFLYNPVVFKFHVDLPERSSPFKNVYK